MVCRRSLCESLLVQGWDCTARAAAPCKLGNGASSWWRKCVYSLALTHPNGVFFRVLVNELLCEKFWLLLLMARAVPARRLLPHQRRAKLPQGKGSAGGRVSSKASQACASAIVNHRSNFSPVDGFKPITHFGFRSRQSLVFPVSLSFQKGGRTLEIGGFPPRCSRTVQG